MIRLLLVAALFAGACGPGAKGGPTMNNRVTAPEPATQNSDVVSNDILAREPLANTSKVKHILIGWKGTDNHDKRAEGRDKAAAEVEVKNVMKQLQAGADFDTLAKQVSEDPGSASGHVYDVSPDAQLVIEFKQLGLRLKVGELGIVESDFGFHIMKRVE